MSSPDSVLDPEVLIKFRIKKLKPEQKKIISSITSGKDCCAILPTGFGKSVCFQIPAVIKGGTCVVISPLVSLMHDQVRGLLSKNIAALAITHENWKSIKDNQENFFSQFSFIYTSPERLSSPRFIEISKGLNISMIVVDEAHCISEWGPSFRPAYREITNYISQFSLRPNISAFTATATIQTVQDICFYLKLNKPEIIAISTSKPLHITHVLKCNSRIDKLLKIARFLEKNPQKGIIYCPTRASTLEWHQLTSAFNCYDYQRASIFHAGLSSDIKQKRLQQFASGVLNILFATSAFGMGIDIPDIKWVIHTSPSISPAAFQQEIGRAGRNGTKSISFACYTTSDWKMLFSLLQKHDHKKLDELQKIFSNKKCISKQLTEYFVAGANSQRCNRCFHCLSKTSKYSSSLDASQKEKEIGKKISKLPITLAQIEIASYVFSRTKLTGNKLNVINGLKDIPGISKSVLMECSKIIQDDTINSQRLPKGLV